MSKSQEWKPPSTTGASNCFYSNVSFPETTNELQETNQPRQLTLYGVKRMIWQLKKRNTVIENKTPAGIPAQFIWEETEESICRWEFERQWDCEPIICAWLGKWKAWSSIHRKMNLLTVSGLCTSPLWPVTGMNRIKTNFSYTKEEKKKKRKKIITIAAFRKFPTHSARVTSHPHTLPLLS